MRVGHTYTSHFVIEARQHELLGLDLGEGVSRRTLLLGIALYALWTGPLLLLLGAPSRTSFTLYFLPPLLATVHGAQRARRTDRRMNLTHWSLTARYLLLGHRPVVCGGRRAAARTEWIPRGARWGGRLDALRSSSALGPLVRRWLGPDDSTPPTAGAPIPLTARPRLYGPDAVARAYGRTKGPGR
ncbi:hypothetical protein [Streptomyces sp. NPDC089919]|uniref:hypothetical protein n=1 Tax=Streptomyces sp. NPDC089919 TaxID=3155188 RepID=UPI0034285A4E